MIRRSFLKSIAVLLPVSMLPNCKVDVTKSVGRGDRGIVYDANGCKIEKCIEANLTTGRCVVFQTDIYGDLIVNSRGDVARLVRDHKAPMRFERIT